MKIYGRHLPWGGTHINHPKMIVVHSMAEYIRFPDKIRSAWYALDMMKLSAHALVNPNGDIIRCRANEHRAYHAGRMDNGADGNVDSLGVEFLVKGEYDYGEWAARIREDWLTEEQFERGVALVKGWMLLYPGIEVVRHSDIANSRKLDPGAGFPWQRFLEALNVDS